LESCAQEVEELIKEDQRLSYWIETLEGDLDRMTKDACYNEHAYVTFDDIKNMGSLTEGDEEALIVIKAPPGTNLEVADPELSSTLDDSEKYKIFMSTNSGEILVYVVSN
jgi:prefoldin subunit 5